MTIDNNINYNKNNTRIFILGGIRSGKTKFACKTAQDSGLDVIYIATAKAIDQEMTERIYQHQSERPVNWGLVEESLYLAKTLETYAKPDRFLIVDCLTIWLSNLLMSENHILCTEVNKFLNILPKINGNILLVSNEVGHGIIPDNILARKFSDKIGLIHQAVAKDCNQVFIIISGIAKMIKG